MSSVRINGKLSRGLAGTGTGTDAACSIIRAFHLSGLPARARGRVERADARPAISRASGKHCLLASIVASGLAADQ